MLNDTVNGTTPDTTAGGVTYHNITFTYYNKILLTQNIYFENNMQINEFCDLILLN